MNTLQFSVDDHGVALISIDLPDRSINVLTPELIAELGEAVERVVASPDTKGAVLTSGKPGTFVAGADVGFLSQMLEDGLEPASAARLCAPMSELLRRMESCGKPFAAALNGLALGGGLELALACHYRVLSDHPKAVVGFPEAGLGLLPGAGGTQRLPRMIGIEKALELLLGGRQLRPGDALALGVVDALAGSGAVVDTARAWILAEPTSVQPWDRNGYAVPGGVGPMAGHASRSFTMNTTLQARQTQRNYPAPLAILSSVYEGTQVPIDVGLKIELKYFGKLLAGSVARNLVRTLFLNKGEADKLVRRPANVPRSVVTRLGVLGAGMMGAGIAHAAAQAGIEVILLDATIEQARKGKEYSARLLEKALARGRTTQDRCDALLERIHPTVAYADLSGCEFVVEAVFENRSVKGAVTGKAAEAVSQSTVFGSNTSTLPITGLAEAFRYQENFIGVHFFSPAERMPLVEVIMGRKTGDAALARTLDLVRQLGKTPIVVRDSRGFFTSRVFGTFIKEGIAMVRQGVQPALIENAARQAGMPIGPLAVTDEVSLDITLHVYDQWVADGAPPPYEPELSIELTRKMIELGRKGRASGAGFYEYPRDGRKHLWPGLAEHFPISPRQPDVEEVKKRFLTIQALEAARCVEEGVIRHCADADIGSILGIGYPGWTGGVISFIDTIGVKPFVADCHRLADRYGERFRPSLWLEDRGRRGESFYQSR